MLNDMKTDIASRFGNFDNSIFMNNLNTIESNRADAINSLSQDILAKQNELVNDELNRRYDYMNFLNGVQNQTVGNILSFLQQASNNSNSGNSYNNSNYSNSSNFGDYTRLASSIASALLSLKM